MGLNPQRSGHPGSLALDQNRYPDRLLGFRQFLLRGLTKVNLEWQLVSCAYNLKRLAGILA